MPAISTINPSSLVPTTTSSATPGGSSNHLLDSSLVGKAIPTNQWWANSILQDSADAIYCYPYNFKCQSTTTPSGLQIGIPTFTNSGGRTVFGGYSLTFNATMVEAYATNQRTLMSFDDMGFKMRWLQATAGNYFESYLYRGQTTVAVYYNNVTPKIDTGGGVAITWPSTTGVNYIKFTTNNGQTWVIQTPTNQSWTTGGTTGQMTAAYTGWVFFTYIPSGLETNITSYVGAVVTGTTVTPTISGSSVNVQYTYTVSTQITGKTIPLIAGLIHHKNRITNASLIDTNFNAAWTTIRGAMYGIAGTSMTFQIPLIATPSQYENPIPSGKLSTITTQLAIDKSITAGATDPYGLGKELGKLGTLAGIADLIGDSTTAATIRGNLKTALTTGLTSSGSYQIQQETLWLGMVTSTDSYGNRTYNDHHFHWGYWLYGGGMLAKSDTSWFPTNSDQERVNCLARDIGNPDPVADTYFPRFRHMDLYEFHSWAHGVLTEGDGKDQESESEALNAYHGLALWGQYSSNTVAQQAGQILLSMETEGVRNYYHYPSATQVIDLKNGVFKHRIPGILFMGKDDYATFFDGNFGPVNYIHCFPVTPGSIYNYYSDISWAAEHYNEVHDLVFSNRDINGSIIFLGNPYGNSWYHFHLQEQALFQPDTVWSLVTGNTLTNIDDGTTLTNILTYVATRPARARPPANFNRSIVTRTISPTRSLVTRSLY